MWVYEFTVSNLYNLAEVKTSEWVIKSHYAEANRAHNREGVAVMEME